jgi:hypothetical protein
MSVRKGSFREKGTEREREGGEPESRERPELAGPNKMLFELLGTFAVGGETLKAKGEGRESEGNPVGTHGQCNLLTHLTDDTAAYDWWKGHCVLEWLQ